MEFTLFKKEILCHDRLIHPQAENDGWFYFHISQ